MKLKDLSSSKKFNFEVEEVLSEMVEILLSVDLKSNEAKANINSFDDNNGKRIFL